MNSNPDMRNRLKEAVQGVEAPPYLATRVRARIAAGGAPGARWAMWLAPAGAVAAAFLGVAIAYQLGHLRLTTTSQESYIAMVTSRIAELLGVGLGDHIHCSLWRKYPDEAPRVEALVERMGPQYSPLIPVVRKAVPESYRMMLAHQCRYHGRRFVHIALVDGSSIMSLVITRKQEGESFDAAGLMPSLVEAGVPMYQANVQRFAITAFESKDHLVYFISDRPQEENSRLMAAMTPELEAFFGAQRL
jgi:hypothetical protein